MNSKLFLCKVDSVSLLLNKQNSALIFWHILHKKICSLQHSSFPEQQWKLYKKMRLIHRPNVTSYPFVKKQKCGNAIWTVSKNIILQSVYEANHMKICFILSVYLKCINNLISTKLTCIYFVRATEKLNNYILTYTNIWVFFSPKKPAFSYIVHVHES